MLILLTDNVEVFIDARFLAAISSCTPFDTKINCSPSKVRQRQVMQLRRPFGVEVKDGEVEGAVLLVVQLSEVVRIRQPGPLLLPLHTRALDSPGLPPEDHLVQQVCVLLQGEGCCTASSTPIVVNMLIGG